MRGHVLSVGDGCISVEVDDQLRLSGFGLIGRHEPLELIGKEVEFDTSIARGQLVIRVTEVIDNTAVGADISESE